MWLADGAGVVKWRLNNKRSRQAGMPGLEFAVARPIGAEKKRRESQQRKGTKRRNYEN
jgi:hypothetical protein